MVGIIYATRREASPLLSEMSAVPISTEPFLTFKSAGESHPPCIVVVSGMGKVAASVATTHLVLVHRVSMLVNAGICGCLAQDNRWSAGDLFRISSAVEGDCDRFSLPERPVTCDNRWFDILEPARLVTCDRPVFNTSKRIRLSDVGDLADMEGAAVARVASLYGIACAMVKGISDASDETGRQELADNIDWISERIAEALVCELAIQSIGQQR